MGVSIIAVIGAVKLAFEIYDRIIEKADEAEESSDLKTGEEKHEHVHDDVLNYINSINNMPDEIRSELKRHITPKIKEHVAKMNDKGIYKRTEIKP